jgi:hypothetical protein
MAAPLSLYNKEEQCAVIGSLRADDVPQAEIHCRLSAQYGNSTLPQQSVYKWITMFKNSHTSVISEE